MNASGSDWLIAATEAEQQSELVPAERLELSGLDQARRAGSNRASLTGYSEEDSDQAGPSSGSARIELAATRTAWAEQSEQVGLGPPNGALALRGIRSTRARSELLRPS